MAVGQKTTETKHGVVDARYAFMAVTNVLPMAATCSAKGSSKPADISFNATNHAYGYAVAEPKVISRCVSLLAKTENEAVTSQRVEAKATVPDVQGCLPSRPSYAAVLSEVPVHLPRRRPFKLPYVAEQICSVAYASYVEVAPVPS